VPREARPQSVNEVIKSAKGHAHSLEIIAPVPFFYISKRDTGWGVVPERVKIASLGIYGASYCGDKLTMAQDGGRVHGDNPPHA